MNSLLYIMSDVCSLLSSPLCGYQSSDGTYTNNFIMCINKNKPLLAT